MFRKKHSKLWLYFAGIVFFTIAVMFMLTSCVWMALFNVGFIQIDPRDRHIPVLIYFFGSLLLGAIIALFVGKLIIRPIQNISNAFDEVSHGNFSVNVSEKEKIAEIREMAKKFNAMTHDLAHIETLRTDFVVNVSHEFKTPLSSIEGYATLLQNHTITPERQDCYTQKILDNSRKLSDLCSNILMLSKLENQEIVSGRSEFRLDEQIRKTILLLEDKWAEKGIEFDMDLPRQMYYGNEALLERVWSNIIDNAIKYSPQNSNIYISIEQKETQLSVTISDTGNGMNEEVQKHIFEKFYQGDTSRKAEGNGLGLALVKRIVDLCHGSIAVQSSIGHGTAFTITLPIE